MKKRNIKYTANYTATADDLKPNVTIDDVLGDLYEQEDGKSGGSSSSSSGTPVWVGVTESIADTAINIFDGIIKPLLGIGSTNTNGVTIETSEKGNTMKYLIIGIVIIVAIILIMKFVKK